MGGKDKKDSKRRGPPSRHGSDADPPPSKRTQGAACKCKACGAAALTRNGAEASFLFMEVFGNHPFKLSQIKAKQQHVPLRCLSHPTHKEQYLADMQFNEVFGMTKSDFNKQPKWKQSNQKKAKNLF